MKRGGAPKRRKRLERNTPMVNKTPFQRKTEMPRGSGLKTAGNAPKRKNAGQAKTNRGLDALKRQARARDMDTCVRCGIVLAGGGNVHHRRNRGMGGSRAANVISNTLTLCGSPTQGCHGAVTLRPWEVDAERYGWVLPTNGTTDPATVPVLVAWLGWALPLADGTWQALGQQAVA